MASTAPTTLEKPKVVLYWLEKSRSQRILWLLEELKVDYELKIFHRNPKTHLAPPELKQVHALGKSPVISVLAPGASEPVLIAESGFITEYLLEHFADGTTLLPKRYKEGQEGKVGCETEEWMRYKFYMHYAEGSLMTFMVLALVAGQIKSSPVPFFIKPITGGVAGKIHSNFLDPNFITHFNFLEEQLTSSPGGGKYLCGPNLTGADILLSFPLLAGRSRTGLTKEKYPKLYDYIDRMEAEPGYKKSVAKIIEIDGKFEITV
ncbi:glutathione S-transferase-like protein [Leptodontidium sp. 2 PMI_412]|nr:glutathione S-transferase-like protein [Leptodontidium sp. 2 PMI_412]